MTLVPTAVTDLEPRWVRQSRAIARPLVFAHRGGAGLAPENTLAAFERAHALGVDGFEFDVRLTRDREVVVIHDADVERTTAGHGRVSGMTTAEVMGLDAGYHFRGERTEGGGETFPFRGRGVRVPLLKDVLARFPDELLIIELKGQDTALVDRTLDVMRAAGALERVCFGGYSWRMLRHLRRREPGVCSSAAREETRWALYRSWVRLPWRRVGYQAFQVPEMAGTTRVVSETFVRAAHAGGLLVQVWTVNEEPAMRRLLGWGVDGLITDVPDVALRVRDEIAGRGGGALAVPLGDRR
jgi:glycerophosphoryl diester phosphodiesterase